MLSRNEIILFNELIEDVYTIDAYDEMRITLLEILDALIPYNQASFYLASNNRNQFLSKPIGKGIPHSELQRYIDDYEAQDYTRWLFMNGKSMVYRETDFFSDKNREDKTYYKEIYIPANIHYSVQLSIAYGGNFLGIITLYREKEKEDFSDKELFILNLLINHLEQRMRKEASLQDNKPESMDNAFHFDGYEYIQRYALTPREVEVLKLLLAGAPNEKVCKDLVISLNTLKKHNRNIYKKLGINNRWELINHLKNK